MGLCATLTFNKIINTLHLCTGLILNITAESSTATSISLKWTAADDRFNYYSVDELYLVKYHMDGKLHNLITKGKSITVPGLKPDTRYTFWVRAVIVNDDDDKWPSGNVTYHTQKLGELFTSRLYGMVHFETISQWL